jgi:hypothetical protein
MKIEYTLFEFFIQEVLLIMLAVCSVAHHWAPAFIAKRGKLLLAYTVGVAVLYLCAAYSLLG